MGNSHIERLIDHLRESARDWGFSETEMEAVVQRLKPPATPDELKMARSILNHGEDQCCGCATTFGDPALIAQAHPSCPRHAEGRVKSDHLCPDHGGEFAHFQCRICNEHAEVEHRSAITSAVLDLERLPEALEIDEDDGRLYTIPLLNTAERNTILRMLQEEIDALRSTIGHIAVEGSVARAYLAKRMQMANSLATAFAEASPVHRPEEQTS